MKVIETRKVIQDMKQKIVLKQAEIFESENEFSKVVS